MKRFFFSVISLMVAATACTESGLVDMPDFYGKTIVFDTYIGKTPVTKAEDIDVEYLQKATDQGGGIQLYAFTSPLNNTNRDNVDYTTPYLNGQLLYSESAVWTYYKGGTPDEPYMPSGKDLAFAAYNLKASSYMSNISTDKTSFDFTVQDVVANQVDLLVTPFTFVSENPSGDTSVPLRFYHLLSKVGFQVQSTGGANTQIIISSIKLHGKFVKSGRVNMTLATAVPATNTSASGSSITANRNPEILPLTEGDDAYSFAYDLFNGQEFSIFATDCETPTRIIPGKSGENYYMMLMPGKVGDFVDTEDLDGDGQIADILNPYIEVSYSLSGQDRLAKIPLMINNGSEAEPQWDNWVFEAGKAYEFIFKITTATIEFSATVAEGWDDTSAPTPIN